MKMNTLVLHLLAALFAVSVIVLISVGASSDCIITLNKDELQKFTKEKGIADCMAKYRDPACRIKCHFEKHGIFDNYANFQESGVKHFVVNFTNGTKAYEKALIALHKKCAKEAENQIRVLTGNGTIFNNCKLFALHNACVESTFSKEISNDWSRFC